MENMAFEKSVVVYAVVGAACANANFRRSLFAAAKEGPQAVERVVGEFLVAVGGPDPTPQDRVKIWYFAADRVLQPAPRAYPDGEEPVGPVATSFEAICEAFARQVCPIWPCDGS